MVPALERHYDPSTETIVSGVICGPIAERGAGMQEVICVPILAEDSRLDVILGPDWFMENQKIDLQEDSSIRVVGSLVGDCYHPALLARELVVAERRVYLRDPSGSPLWRMWPTQKS